MRLAAKECDEVHLFVSSSDRKRPGELPIYGADMMSLWDKYIEASLPSNVIVFYGGQPVRHVYEELAAADTIDDIEVTYVIYSDTEEIKKYTDENLERIAPALFRQGRIKRRGLQRSETGNVSGTQMRALLAAGKTEEFAELLPPKLRPHAQEFIDTLLHATPSDVIREYVRGIVTESNLGSSHMKGNRFQKFLLKMTRGEPFTLVGGGEVIIPMKGRGNDALIKALKAEDATAYAAAFKMGVVDSKGNLVMPTSLQKTAEFGGKDVRVSLAAESGQIDKIAAAISSAGDGQPIDIRLGSKMVRRVINVVKVKGTPKADAALVDDSGRSVAYLSLKASDIPERMQQWGGITALVGSEDAEALAFVDDVKALVKRSKGKILTAPVYRKIKSQALKRTIVYGSKVTPEDAVDAVIATEGDIRLVAQGDAFEFEIDSGEILYYPDLPAGNWAPVFLARPNLTRTDMGIPHTRVGVFPLGYRASSRVPIDDVMRRR